MGSARTMFQSHCTEINRNSQIFILVPVVRLWLGRMNQLSSLEWTNVRESFKSWSNHLKAAKKKYEGISFIQRIAENPNRHCFILIPNRTLLRWFKMLRRCLQQDAYKIIFSWDQNLPKGELDKRLIIWELPETIHLNLIPL